MVALGNAAGSGRWFADEHLSLLSRFNRLVGAALERADILERIGSIEPDDARRNDRLRDQAEELARLDDDGDEAFRMAISLLARAAEIYDEGTGNHVFRVNEYSHFLGQTLGLDDATCRELRYSAQLHDVGKMGVAPAVLRKTGPLSAAERREMDNHTIYGQRILSRSPRLNMAAEIARNHHEKWDGSGYPSGKRADEIPLAARIVQMADIYDALRAPRPYKPALDHARACEIILHGDERIDSRGHFDPRLVEAFADRGLQATRWDGDDAEATCGSAEAAAPSAPPFDLAAYRRHAERLPELEKRLRLLSQEYREVQRARPIEAVALEQD